jgi:hypothetical protein
MYAEASKNLIGSNPIDFVNDTIKVMLCTSSYTPSIAHDFKNDITNEITGTGYTAGGLTLTSKTATRTSGNTVYTAANATWSGATFTTRYAVVYKDTGVSSTSPLICYFDFGTDQSPAGVNYTLTWDATNGIFKMTTT